jgi:hypothetical protein
MNTGFKPAHTAAKALTLSMSFHADEVKSGGTANMNEQMSRWRGRSSM